METEYLRVQELNGHAHYELEFEQPCSTLARKLFTDVERTLSLGALEVAQNGSSTACDNKSTMACSNSHNTQTAASSSSPHIQFQDHTVSAISPYGSPSSSRPPVLGTFTNRLLQTSPSSEKRKSVEEEVFTLCRVPEDSDPMEFPSICTSDEPTRHKHDDQEDAEYGGLGLTIPATAGSNTSHDLGGQPLAMGEEDEEEEEQWLLDEELARQGLYRGSYGRLMAFYSLTPVFTVLIFLTLAYLPKIAYPLPADTTPGAPYPYSPFLPFPLPEILTATAFWALSHLLNSFIFSFFSSILVNQPIFSISLGSLIQSSLGVILRQAVVPILLIPRNAVFDHPTWNDISFRRTWWIALGWAAAEAVVGIKQGYDGIALYRDVLVSVRRVVSTPNQTQNRQHVPISGYGTVNQEERSRRQVSPGRMVSNSRDLIDLEGRPLLERCLSVTSSAVTQSDAQLKDAIEEEVERDVNELLALRGREELEDLYGMPFIHIPVFISCLHRLNSVLLVLGSTLLLTAAYLRSSIALSPPNPLHDQSAYVLGQHWSAQPHGDKQLLITFPFIVVLHWILSLLHSPRILPCIGVQTFVYVGLLLSLGVFFAGLGVWEGIV